MNQQKPTLEVSGKELHLILEMRKYEYGKFTVNKQDGQLILLEATGNIMLKNDMEMSYSE